MKDRQGFSNSALEYFHSAQNIATIAFYFVIGYILMNSTQEQQISMACNETVKYSTETHFVREGIIIGNIFILSLHSF